MDLFIQYSVAAASMATEDGGFKVDPEDAENVGVIIGVGLCGIDTIEATERAYLDGGPRKISPFFIPKVISNLAPGQIADPTWGEGSQLDTNVGLRIRNSCDRRSISSDPAWLAGCGYRGRGRIGHHAPGGGRFRFDEGAFNPQRRTGTR